MKRKIIKKLTTILMSGIMLFGMPIVLGSNGAWAKTVEDKAAHTIMVSPAAIDFGIKNVGYTQPDAQSVTLRNTGNSIVKLSQPSAASFVVGKLSTTIIEAGDTATFTVQPKADLTANNYNEIIKVNTDNGATAEVNVIFMVNEAFTANIIECENQTLKAFPKGGSGIYTYQWYEGSSAIAFSADPEVKVSPTETTTYKVVINDTIEEKAATVTVTPTTHTIVASPTAIEFAAKNAGYKQPDAQTVKITNTGNNTVILNQLSGTNYAIGALTKTSLAAGDTATFTVQPKANLAAGSYNETIKVSTDKETSTEVKLNFKVNKAFTVTISPSNPVIIEGQNQTLQANPEGGSGNYTYQWYEGSSANVFSADQEVKVSPAETTTYKVVVNDGTENKAATVMVTVPSKSQQAPKIISGANRTWTKGSKSGMSFTSDADFSEFLSVSVDGKKIAEDNYTAKSGSTVVTLKPEYLKTLAAGKHTLGIVSELGTAETTFTILNSKTSAITQTISKVPQTGDTSKMVLWSTALLITGCGVIGSIIINRLNKKGGK